VATPTKGRVGGAYVGRAANKKQKGISRVLVYLSKSAKSLQVIHGLTALVCGRLRLSDRCSGVCGWL